MPRLISSIEDVIKKCYQNYYRKKELNVAFLENLFERKTRFKVGKSKLFYP